MALAVVKDAALIYAKGLGLRDVEKNLPVTPSTLFAAGSTTKAFTSASLGILVDAGILDLDKPALFYDKDFALASDVATQTVTLRDFLLHRSGLPRHELAHYGTEYSEDLVYSRPCYLKISAPSQEVWQYSNLGFLSTVALLLEVGIGAVPIINEKGHP